MEKTTKERTAKNASGDVLRVGDGVDRLDNYKKDGKIMAINHDRGQAYVLVRWPNLEDVWMNPEILYARGNVE